jgi:hypothetical protein
MNRHSRRAQAAIVRRNVGRMRNNSIPRNRRLAFVNAIVAMGEAIQRLAA